MIFGTAYYPEHRDPSRWEYDLKLMARAHIDAVRVGEFAWCRMEPAEGMTDFSWLDEFAELAARHGIRILLCPPMRTVPAWLIERDPSMAILDEDGIRLDYGSRYSFCINNALLRRKGLDLAEMLARHMADNPTVLAWHLDNEYGDEPPCHCDACRAAFHAWLEARYGTPEALNKAWGMVFWGLEVTSFSQVPTPARTKTRWNPAHMLAWRRFRSDTTVELIRQHAEAVRRGDPAACITTNFQGLYQFKTDFHKALPHIDVPGTNFYPRFNDEFPCPHTDGYQTLQLDLQRTMGGGRFQMLELRSGAHAVPGRGGPEPGQIENVTMQVLAHGAEAAYYFRWRIVPFGPEQLHGAVTGYDGQPGRAYDEVARTGERIKKLTELVEGTRVMSHVGLLYDYETRMVDNWCRESVPAVQDLSWKTLQKYDVAVRKYAVNLDAPGTGQDWAGYRVLIVPQLALVDDAVVGKLRDWVAGGGTLVWNPLCGTMDPEMTVYPTRLHPGLEELLGVDLTEFHSLLPGRAVDLTMDGETFHGELFVDLAVPRKATVVAAYSEGWLKGRPAVLENTFGKGKAITVTCFAEQQLVTALVQRVLKGAGIEPLIAGLPEQVEACGRSGDDYELLFVINHAGGPRTLELPEACQVLDGPPDGVLGPFEVAVLKR